MDASIPTSRATSRTWSAWRSNSTVAAWKTYTQWGPDGRGFFMDDEPGVRMIEEARRLGVRNIAIHKGLPFGPRSYEHSTCVDIGRVAKRYPGRQLPDLPLRLRHRRKAKAPTTAKRSDGIDALMTSLREQRHRQGRQRVCRTRFDLALPDARSRHGRACARQAARAPGRGQRAVGHRFDLVWQSAGSDPGVPRVPDFRRSSASDSATRSSRPAIRAKVFGRNALKLYPVPEDVLDEAPGEAMRCRGAGRIIATRRIRDSSPMGRRRGASS